MSINGFGELLYISDKTNPINRHQDIENHS
jgi:hypothetical protein